jgi:uncharacterized membrane protein (UPF0127 family)
MKNIRRRILATSLLLATLFSTGPILLHAAPPDKTLDRGLLTIVTAQGDLRFRVEVADTPVARARGLQGRQTLAADAGMLFVLERPQKMRMWMRDTLIPLDMLFIDAEGGITNIAAETTPFSLTPIAAAKAVTGVLEIPGGSAARLGIRPGDRVIHPAFARSEPVEK